MGYALRVAQEGGKVAYAKPLTGLGAAGDDMKEKDSILSTPSSGNVFRDLELPDAEELLVKSSIAAQINDIIDKRGLSQSQAAAILGVPQPKISMIQNGKLRGFSLEKLCHFLTRFGHDVEIVISPNQTDGVGRMRVTGL